MRVRSLILFYTMYAAVKSDSYNVIDLSDILNVDYMPGSLLILENPEGKYKNVSETLTDKHIGSFDDAFTTMGYHRKMMNEYLCRTYVSEQIISEMKSTRIRRRLGTSNNSNKKDEVEVPKSSMLNKANLLEDEGSSSYQKWLKKSTTLEDIYRHYDDTRTREALANNRDGEDDINEDYDAQITGYAYQQPQAGSPSKLGHGGTGTGYSYSAGGGSTGGGYGLHGGMNNGFASGGGYYGGHPDHIVFNEGGSGHNHGSHDHGSHDHVPKYHGSGSDKDKLADLFDIALTALAYLSFGMFIIQVIMCISMTNTTTAPAMTMMPMSMSSTGGEPTGGGMSENYMIGDGVINGGGTADGVNGDISGNGFGGDDSDYEIGYGKVNYGGGGDEGNLGENVGEGEGSSDSDGVGISNAPGDGSIKNNEDNTVSFPNNKTYDNNRENSINKDSIIESNEEGSNENSNEEINDEETEDDSDINKSESDNRSNIMDGEDDNIIENGDVYSQEEDGIIRNTFGDGRIDFMYNYGGGSGNSGINKGWEKWVVGGGTTDRRYARTTAADSSGTGGDETATGRDGDDREYTKFKRKRDIPIISQPNNEIINELARRILISIEAALVAHQDDGNCLRKTLCENNFYSRELDSNQKYWIPVWSLGMSWLSGRLVNGTPRTTSMLDSLKASLLGLGKADCEFTYRNCDLNKERHRRRRRRKKRQI